MSKFEYFIDDQTGEFLGKSEAFIDELETKARQKPLYEAAQAGFLAHAEVEKAAFIEGKQEERLEAINVFIDEQIDGDIDAAAQNLLDAYIQDLDSLIESLAADHVNGLDRSSFGPSEQALEDNTVYLLSFSSTFDEPEDQPEGYVSVREGDKWIAKEDHRNKTIFNIGTGEASVVNFIGEIPEAFTIDENDFDIPPHLVACTLDELKAGKLKQAEEAFERGMSFVTTGKGYSRTEQRGWSKQEKAAYAWIQQLDSNGNATEDINDHKMLLKMVAGRLWKNVIDVQPDEITERAHLIINNSDVIAPYYGALVGVLHKIQNDIEGIDEFTLDDEGNEIGLNGAKLKVNEIETDDIDAVAFAELVELQAN